MNLAELKTLITRTDRIGTESGKSKSINLKDIDLYIQDHANGIERIGFYTTFQDNSCKWSVLDFDLKGDNHKTGFDDFETLHNAAKDVCRLSKDLGLQPNIEISKSNGIHIWILYSNKIPAKELRNAILGVLNEFGLIKKVELFPKQDEIDALNGGLGNFVWLPWYGKDVAQDRTVLVDENLKPLPVQKFSVSESTIIPQIIEDYPLDISIKDETSKYNENIIVPTEDLFKLEDLGKVRGNCLFIRWWETNQNDTTEQQWEAGISNLKFFKGGHEKIHEVSATYNINGGYSRKSTDRKIYARTGKPFTCNTIRSIYNGCSSCKLEVNSPIGIIMQGLEDKKNIIKSQESKAQEIIPNGKNEYKLLVFPETVISGIAGEFTNLYIDYLEVPKEFLYVSFLTCLGAILSNKLTISSELSPQPRLYTLLLGESADDRKSTAITKTVDLFKTLSTGFDICNGIGSSEGLSKKLKNIDGESKNLLLCVDEFKNFVSKCKIESSVLLPCVTTLFENNSYESHTKNASIDLENIHLSLLAASTVQTYERTWDSSFTDIGFNNRIFIVPGSSKRKYSIPKIIPESKKNQIKKKLDKVIEHVNKYPKLKINTDALKLYDEWYFNLEGSIHTKRLDTYALRLMVILAANELRNTIDIEIVEKVISLCNWQFKVRQLHDPIDADNKIAELEEKIRRTLKNGEQAERHIKQYTHYNRYGIWYFETAKKNLIKSKEIEWNKKTNKWFLIQN